MHQHGQAQESDPGLAESGLNERPGRSENGDRTLLGAGSGSPAVNTITPITSATITHTSTIAGGSAPREAVMLTDGRDEAHRYQREERQPLQHASTGSHGAAIGERRDHVSSTPAVLPSNGANPSPNPDSSSNSSPSTGASAGAGVIDTMTTSAATTTTTTTAAAAAATAESYEHQHVHSVYESIASHFSSTRYKPWPFVASFLASLPPGSVGLDVGCGNGKYLDVNRDIVILGSDRSANLARLARELKVTAGAGSSPGADVVGVADGLALPFGGGSDKGLRRVDFAICIAVIHHLSTRERRIEGVRALLDCVAPRTGKVLVYVWALEQGTSRRGWDEGTTGQDQLVPWVMKSNKPKKQKGDEASNKKGNSNVNNGAQNEAITASETTYQRYYHLYRKGELEEDVQAAGGEVLGSGYEKDNWWVIASPKEYPLPST